MPHRLLLMTTLLVGTIPAADLTIHTDRPGIPVAPTLYGIFFEDINRSGDGGLYAEMVQNRSFEDHPTFPVAWTALINANAHYSVNLDFAKPLNANNPLSLKLDIMAISGGRVGIFNQGFKGAQAGKCVNMTSAWLESFNKAQEGTKNGLSLRAGAAYQLNLRARAENFSGTLTVTLENRTGKVLAKQIFSGLDKTWKNFDAILTPTETDPDARLVLATETTGSLWFDMVSLFPKDTWKERPNGWRADLMDLMVGMKPGLFRFPGGSFSEGVTMMDAWKWKETLGDIAQRPGVWNIWGYRSTNGLGYHEYLQMAEDLGAEPLYVAHIGMAEKDLVPLNRVDPWVKDALDAIEYANGSVTSTWGAKRAAAGHPKPFNLKYVEIGNENGMGYSWGGGTREDYLPRYRALYEAIKKTCPDIITIANAHTEPDVPAEIVDEHYYETPDWFFKAATKYDGYDRTKPKIYVGEYAAQKGKVGHGNLVAALSEAAFLTGLERNSDVVIMSSYAPLFTNPQWSRWNPDAIVFDSTRVYVTPSYHVQALFAGNRPDTVLPIDHGASTTLFASAGTTKGGDLIVKLVNRSEQNEAVTLKLSGAIGQLSAGIATTLTGANLEAENSFAQPNAIAPTTATVPAFTVSTAYSCPPRSLTVLRWAPAKP